MLNDPGHEAERVFDVGPADAPEDEICQHAPEHEAVLEMKGEDFANMVATGREAPPVVWIRTGNARRAALLAWFEPLVDQVVAMIQSGDWVVELW